LGFAQDGIFGRLSSPDATMNHGARGAQNKCHMYRFTLKIFFGLQTRPSLLAGGALVNHTRL
jgi:hypothetical protein